MTVFGDIEQSLGPLSRSAALQRQDTPIYIGVQLIHLYNTLLWKATELRGWKRPSLSLCQSLLRVLLLLVHRCVVVVVAVVVVVVVSVSPCHMSVVWFCTDRFKMVVIL